MTAGCWNSTMSTGMTSAEDLVHAVLTNEKMWDQDLTKIEGLEESGH